LSGCLINNHFGAKSGKNAFLAPKWPFVGCLTTLFVDLYANGIKISRFAGFEF